MCVCVNVTVHVYAHVELCFCTSKSFLPLYIRLCTSIYTYTYVLLCENTCMHTLVRCRVRVHVVCVRKHHLHCSGEALSREQLTPAKRLGHHAMLGGGDPKRVKTAVEQSGVGLELVGDPAQIVGGLPPVSAGDLSASLMVEERKVLSLGDDDTLTYHQNKLKQAQNDLLQSQTEKKQDKLLVNGACDHGDAGVPAGQNLSSMWNYL